MFVYLNYATVPSKVTGVSVSPMVTSNQPSLHVTWSAPSGNILQYIVDYKVGNSVNWSRWDSNPISPPVTLTGLQRGTIYLVRVNGVFITNNQSWTSTGTGTTYDGKLQLAPYKVIEQTDTHII